MIRILIQILAFIWDVTGGAIYALWTITRGHQ